MMLLASGFPFGKEIYKVKATMLIITKVHGEEHEHPYLLSREREYTVTTVQVVKSRCELIVDVPP